MSSFRPHTRVIALLVLGSAALITGCAGGTEVTGAGGAGAGATSTGGTGGSTGGAGGASTSSTSASTSSGTGGTGGDATSSSASGGGGGASSSGTGGGGGGDPIGITLTGSNPTMQYGNLNGGSPYNDPCPAGQVIIGFSGFLTGPAGYHGKMQALCGIPAVSGGGPFTVTISAGGMTPLHGLLGSTPWTSTCPADQMVIGFSGRAGALIDAISVRCAPLVISGSPGSYTIAPGAITTLPQVGGNGGNPFPITDCAAGQVATMVRLRAGDGIDAFGLACSAVGLSY